MQAEFLAQNAVVREALGQHLAQRPFRRMIGDRNGALVGLQLGGDPGPEMRADRRRGSIGRGLGNLDQAINFDAGHVLSESMIHASGIPPPAIMRYGFGSGCGFFESDRR